MSRTHTHAPYWVRVTRANDAVLEHHDCPFAPPHECRLINSDGTKKKRIQVKKHLEPRWELVEKVYGLNDNIPPNNEGVVRDPLTGKRTVSMLVFRDAEDVVVPTIVNVPTTCTCLPESEQVFRTLKKTIMTLHRSEVKRSRSSERRQGRMYAQQVTAEYNSGLEISDDPILNPY